ncbi:dolichyl-diphosphooligosaccharide--protein glycosyltransferase 48 kDa subunit [Phtheirospermum japonicum]|uniref:Dolichyl-diphosphooligosaccharide--protein glycosyltransferase 48 kDa subunit n=1 Tax=Phtheirospermum japonicum TaxID=374723 RepID=A0A830CE89_9LAMI|nr:dolichyl-diphosphooligosaccharide--protein glycosyltransferase 48 kDa subunit [Phtheirospermum japonicum]
MGNSEFPNGSCRNVSNDDVIVDKNGGDVAECEYIEMLNGFVNILPRLGITQFFYYMLLLGHDLILTADASTSELIREIAVECGVDFDEDPAALVINHTSYAVSETEGDHTLIASDDFIQSEVILGSKKIEPISALDTLPPRRDNDGDNNNIENRDYDGKSYARFLPRRQFPLGISLGKESQLGISLGKKSRLRISLGKEISLSSRAANVMGSDGQIRAGRLLSSTHFLADWI